MPPGNFLCKRCGRCCTDISGGYQGTVDKKELRLWIKKAPPHVREWIVHLFGDLYDYFISPQTGDLVNRCPWLRNYKSDRYREKGFRCLIQKGKPPACEAFPQTVSFALECKCQGFSHLSEEEINALLAKESIKDSDDV